MSSARCVSQHWTCPSRLWLERTCWRTMMALNWLVACFRKSGLLLVTCTLHGSTPWQTRILPTAGRHTEWPSMKHLIRTGRDRGRAWVIHAAASEHPGPLFVHSCRIPLVLFRGPSRPKGYAGQKLPIFLGRGRQRTVDHRLFGSNQTRCRLLPRLLPRLQSSPCRWGCQISRDRLRATDFNTNKLPYPGVCTGSSSQVTTNKPYNTTDT